MNHVDEGTIHAWLDGALDADRGRDVEAHVRDCAACSAAVAEARGLVAASSRILSALDDVPNVIPAIPKRPTSEPKRMWRAAPWVTGIAAVLLAAVLLRTTSDEPDFAEKARSMDSVRQDARVALDSMVPRQTEAAAPLAGPPAPSTRVLESRPRKSEVPERMAQADAPPTLQDMVVTSTAMGAEPLDSMPASEIAGCYQVRRLARASVAAQAQPTADRVQRRSAAGAAAAPAAPSVAEYAPSSFVIRLDTLRGRPGFIIRSATSDSSLGWWQRIARDTARADLYVAGPFLFTPSQRVTCPD